MIPDFVQLKHLLASVRIVHHIRGRVRFKFDKNAASGTANVDADGAPDRKTVTAAIERIDGIVSWQVNVLARSCTVQYDPTQIPDAAWQDWLSGKDSADADVLEHKFRRAYAELKDADHD